MQYRYCLLILFLSAFLFISDKTSAQYNLSLVGHYDYDTIHLSSLWGYTDDAGNEYALVGTELGTSIVDLTNPALPVELFFVPGKESTWREIKTWNHHAYITTEGGGGVLIIDLSYLPTAIDTISFTGDLIHPIERAHTLFIDENGIAYFFGFNALFGDSEGAYMVDLNADPEHPEFIGTYTGKYFHDGFVRNDTLWAAEIFEGRFEVFDISDKTSFVSLGYQYTPVGATHNCEPDATGNYLFATEETIFGKLRSYDISDPSDIKLLDGYNHFNYSTSFPHNVHFINNYLINAHYTEGVSIVDATHPENLIEVGWYDTSPLDPGAFFSGAWEAYPYFNSGFIIASDIQEGLFVLQPDYQRACYLTGTVKNEITLSAIFNATIEIDGPDISDSTDLSGEFKTGYYQNGTYNIIVSAEGCTTKTYSDIILENGEITTLNATLNCGETGIDEFDPEISIQYLQAEQAIEINYLPSNQSIYLRLTDISGKIIYNNNLSGSGNDKISTSDLPAATYLISVFNSTFTKNISLGIF